MLGEVLPRIDGDKDAVADDDRLRGVAEMADGLDIDLAPLPAEDVGPQVQRRADRHRGDEVDLEVHRDGRRSDQQRNGPHHLVHRGRQDASVNDAGAALESGLHQHRRLDGEPVCRAYLQVQSLCRLGATAEAQRIMHADRLPRRSRFGVALQRVEVGGHHEVTFHVPLP